MEILFISTSGVALYFVRAFRVTACSTALPSPPLPSPPLPSSLQFAVSWVRASLLNLIQLLILYTIFSKGDESILLYQMSEVLQLDASRRDVTNDSCRIKTILK